MPASSVAEFLSQGAGGHGDQGGFSGNGDDASRNWGVPERVYVTGMLLALGGILMFFMALVSSWVVRKGFSYGDWQPLGLPRILWLNSLILAASSATLARSHRFLRRGCAGDSRHWWSVTAILGLLFLAGQLLAWRQMFASGFFFATNPASSFFYVFTAAHGLHVLGGIVALLTLALRPPRRLTRETATQVVALYWHFLAILWLFLLTILVLG